MGWAIGISAAPCKPCAPLELAGAQRAIAAQSLQRVNTERLEDNPSLTGDERVIVFGSDRPGGSGGADIWYATRGSASESFAEPRPLPVINSPEHDRETYISPDGCEIYFSSDRPGGKGNYDIYRTRFVSPSY